MPTIDTTPSTVATNALQAIPFSAIIGGPLDAAIKAQALAAQTSWEFIQQVGLNTDPKTGERSAVTVMFQYQKDGQMVNIIVPLLAIVPIPYIAIDTITIDFMAKIDASASTYAEQAESTEASMKGSTDISVGWGIFSAKMHMEGGVSSKSSSKATQDSKYSVEYTVNIHVEAGQESMPAGLAAVLNLLNSSIAEGKPGGTFDASPVNTTFDSQTPASISIRSRNSTDRAVTDDISLTVTPPTGVKAADIKISATVGTLDTAGTKLTPSAAGLAGLELLYEGTPLTAAQAGGKLELKQKIDGTDRTATIDFTIVPTP